MNPRSILLLVLLGFARIAHAGEPIAAASIKWEGHFGGSEANPTVLYCLMARGFFQTPTSPEMPKSIAAWLQEHPKAVAVPISSLGLLRDQDPDSKLTYVWLTDGEQNLNLELVRQGCFRPETQTLGKDQKLEAAQAGYDAFVQKVMEAGKAAQEKKLGVWKERHE